MRFPSDQDASGRTFGAEELAALTKVLQSGTLTSTKGTAVKAFEERFGALLGVNSVTACSSGSAAIHTAIAAIDPEPGDEIVTSSITDMGALTPILYQGAIPVFADVDPITCNVTAATIAKAVSPRTRAIVVTHLFGNPCDMPAIMELSRSLRIPVIEDCAQAFLAQSDGRYVGTFGAISAFSLQQGKHITCGEGGLVVTNDQALARRAFLFVNKAWGYGDPAPDHYFLALNYRMSELQGAVALAQLDRLEDAVRHRRELAKRFSEMLRDVPGIEFPQVSSAAQCSYWKVALRVDRDVIGGGAVAMGRELSTYGLASAPRYIQKPAFECAIFRDKRTFGQSSFPFSLARPEALDYSAQRFPGTYAGLESVLVLPWNDLYTQAHLDYLVSAIRGSALKLNATAAAVAG